jgi:Tol biopolymer transport system component/tRNA A-37 threonylcarbamoyl transferase component Bud32
VTPSRWRQIESLYYASLERASGERAAFLEQACSDDPDLRREVESLLSRASQTGALDGIVQQAAGGALADSVATAFVAGSEIGSYRIESQIGEGGMGVVYKALDTRLNRPVAVKLLSSRLADAAARRRFQREAQMASSLNHPHILTVYDAGEIEGRQYLVTEYIDGGTLRDWSKSGKRTWTEIVELLAGVADGLATAHDANILHRDIKPANILIMKSGYAKLADFGLARLAEEALDPTHEAKTLTVAPTRAGVVLGTIAYMSPEQARGEAIDARSDIFSFGVVLHELLSSRRLFAGQSDLEILQKVIREEPPPLGDHVPSALGALVEKALRKDPDERCQTMREMVSGMRGLVRASSPHALLPEQPAIAAGGRKRRSWVGYSAAAAIVLLAGAAAAWYLRVPGKRLLAVPSEFVQLTNFSDYATAPAISHDGTMVAFFRGGSYFLGTGQVYVKVLLSGESKQLTDDGHRKYRPTFTPDGSRVAYTRQDRAGWETWTVPVLGGAPSRLMQNSAGLSWIGPDRVLFSAVMPGTVLHMGIISARESRAEEREIYFPSHERAMAHYSWPSPDLRSVLIVEMDRTGDWQRCRMVPMDGTSPGAQAGPQGACTAAGWSPDGKWMYFNAEVNGSTHLWRQRFPNGVPEQITFGPTEEEGLAVSPDGKSLITSIGVRPGSVWVRDASGDHRIPVDGSASDPVFSADGQRLYYLLKKASSSDTAELWARDLASGKSVPVITDQKIIDYDISPDQQSVAFTAQNAGTKSIYIASVDRGSAPRLLTKDADGVSFAGSANLIFRQLKEKASYLVRVHADGTGMERVVETPILEKLGTSADGEWAVAGGRIDPSKPPGAYAISLRDRSRRGICRGPCLVRWSPGGKFLFVTLSRAPSDIKNALSASVLTVVVPLPKGLKAAAIPDDGFDAISEDDPAGLRTLPGLRAIRQSDIAPGLDPNTYAYTSAEFQGNLFRVPLH